MKRCDMLVERNYILVFSLPLTQIRNNNTSLFYNSFNKAKEQFLGEKNVP